MHFSRLIIHCRFSTGFLFGLRLFDDEDVVGFFQRSRLLPQFRNGREIVLRSQPPMQRKFGEKFFLRSITVSKITLFSKLSSIVSSGPCPFRQISRFRFLLSELPTNKQLISDLILISIVPYVSFCTRLDCIAFKRWFP